MVTARSDYDVLIVGVMYIYGRGVPRDHEQAMYWFSRAAEQGEAMAQYNIAYMHLSGLGVPQDYQQAAYWYTKAAELGHTDAQVDLGVLYANGWGVSRDYVQAYLWWSLAADQGNHTAGDYLLRVEKQMTREQTVEAQRLVGAWMLKQQ